MLQIESDKTPHYINLTSPDPGNYFVAAFLPWSDPKDGAITQQGRSMWNIINVSFNSQKLYILLLKKTEGPPKVKTE